MASELRVNTLKDASGNNSIATSFVAGGSAKVWNCFDASGTITLRDSLNVSSLTDNGTSNFDTNVSSAFVNDDYAFNGTIGLHTGAATQTVGGTSATAKDTGQYGIRSSNYQNSFGDSNDYMTTAHGDLA